MVGARGFAAGLGKGKHWYLNKNLPGPGALTRNLPMKPETTR
jgi:hypothetical protein